MIEPIDLHGFVDGELSPSRFAEVQAALLESKEAAGEAEEIRQIKLLLQSRIEQPESADSWKACIRRLNEIDKARRVESLVGRFAPVLCGVLILCIFFAGLAARRSGISSRGNLNLAQIVGSMTTVNKPDQGQWLENLIKQSRLSTPDHLEIRSVREGVIGGLPSRLFSARDADGDLAILLIPQVVQFEGMTQATNQTNLLLGRLGTMNCVSRTEGDNTVVVIADRTYENLVAVLSEVKVKVK